MVFGGACVTFILLAAFLGPLPWLALCLLMLKETFFMKRKAGKQWVLFALAKIQLTRPSPPSVPFQNFISWAVAVSAVGPEEPDQRGGTIMLQTSHCVPDCGRQLDLLVWHKHSETALCSFSGAVGMIISVLKTLGNAKYMFIWHGLMSLQGIEEEGEFLTWTFRSCLNK